MVKEEQKDNDKKRKHSLITDIVILEIEDSFEEISNEKSGRRVEFDQDESSKDDSQRGEDEEIAV